MTSRKWWVLAAVGCGTFMATLDSSIVNIALPTLVKSLSSDLYRIKWVVIIYLLFLTCFLLPFGRMSDLYGRRMTFQCGYLLFSVASALCGLSSTTQALLASRALQGLGAAMLMANGPAIITAAFPAGERGKALGTLAMVVSAGLISGPSIGGFLIAHFSWESIFWINVPLGVLGVMLVRRHVAKDTLPKQPPPFDWAGAFLQMAVLLGFIAVVDPPMISISGSMPFHVSRWVIGAVTIVAGVIFVKVELEAEAPLFDFSLMKIRTFWTANLAAFLTFLAFSSLTVLMPFFLEEVMKLTPGQAGLFMTAIPLTILVVAPIAGRLSDHSAGRGIRAVGALVGALALFIMAGAFGMGIHAGASRAGVILGLCSIGLATGLFQSPNNNAIMGAVPSSKLGVASALLATIRNLGLVAGTGMAAGIFGWRLRKDGNFVEALHFVFYVSGVIAVGAMIASLARKERRPPTHGRMET